MALRRSTVVAFALLSGCDHLFNLETVSPARNDAGADALVDGMKTTGDAFVWCIDDRFAALDGNTWYVYFNPGTSVVAMSGQLVMTLADQVSGNSYLGVERRTNFVNKAIEIEVVEVPSTAPGIQAALFVGLDGSDIHIIEYGQNQLDFSTRANDVLVGLDTTSYSGTLHRYWRLRHESGPNMFYFETSEDRTSWMTRHTSPNHLDLSSIRIGVLAGTYQSITDPGRFVLTNMRTDACVP